MRRVITTGVLLAIGLLLSAQPSRAQGRPGNFSSLYLGPSATARRVVPGSGSPEGVVTAAVGSVYFRTDGGAGTAIYVKASGVGNTGWLPLFAQGSSPTFATVTTTGPIELGHASDTTVARSAAGVVQVEGVTLARATDNLSFFGATTCANFASVISSETGTCGNVVLSDSPAFTTQITTPKVVTASGDLTVDPTGDTIVKGSTSVTGTAALDVQNSGGTSMLYVRNDGNVGIGTTNPTTPLDVAGSIRLSDPLIFAGTSGQIRLGTNDGGDTGHVEMGGGGGLGQGRGAVMQFWGNENPSYPGWAQIYTGNMPTSRFEVTKNDGLPAFVMAGATGNVGIGTTGPQSKLHIGAGDFEMEEKSAPTAPGANNARIFVQDNGAGKTQLCVLFSSGAAQCFATQP